MAPIEDDQDGRRRAIEQFESRRRFERLPKSSGELISKLISRRGFTQDQFNDQLQSAWQRVAGTRMANRTRATMIRRGQLEVVVDSSPALQQLGFEKTRLLRRLQQELPTAGIRGLRFRVGNLPAEN